MTPPPPLSGNEVIWEWSSQIGLTGRSARGGRTEVVG